MTDMSNTISPAPDLPESEQAGSIREILRSPWSTPHADKTRVTVGVSPSGFM